MPIVIREVTSEIALEPEVSEAGATPEPTGGPDEELLERLVRRATERVLERLRLEWEE